MKKHSCKSYFPIVYVEWIDAASMCDVGWKTEDVLDEFLEEIPWLIKDVGFLKSETKDYVCLIGGHSPVDEDYALTCHRDLKIPKGCIRKMIRLKLPKGKR